MDLNDSSHSIALAEEQATDGPPGTHSAALGCRSSYSLRHQRTALSDAMPRSPAGRIQNIRAGYVFSILPLPHILSCGLMRIATSRNFLSRNGTRASTPMRTSLCWHAHSQTYAGPAAYARSLRAAL
ncbi:hypothetical protein L1887_52547 [Cichorium endivia]|nr:hypothetical protein L1887_52547 [Cichorium endivia]